MPSSALTPKKLPLLRRSITLEDALVSDENILQELTYPTLDSDFRKYIYSHRSDIIDLVARHLGCNPDNCIAETSLCRIGSFNLCLPVQINDPNFNYPSKRVMFRIPLPYKVAEATYPGNAEEKLRCELATYIWMRQNCPTVQIPALLGFGFASGPSFVLPQTVPFFQRVMWHARRFLSWAFRRSLPCEYIITQKFPQTLGHGYMVLEYIEDEMLSMTWNDPANREDDTRRANLFRNLSRIILSLAQYPLPSIGSFTLDNRGFIHLNNRPLTLRVQHLENEGIPTINRDQMYLTSDTYMLDMLACFDSKLKHQPNSLLNELDGYDQMAAVTLMRATYCHYLQQNLRHGPFVFTLTDLSHSNIMVDEDWNIKAVVDLEWACSQPLEMLRVPWWLADRVLDGLNPEDPERLVFSKRHDEFLKIFEEEEKELRPTKPLFPVSSITDTIRHGWKNDSFWFFHALETPNALFGLFTDHILPRYGNPSPNFESVVYPYWNVDANQFIQRKLKDKEDYNIRLRNTFERDDLETRPTQN